MEHFKCLEYGTLQIKPIFLCDLFTEKLRKKATKKLQQEIKVLYFKYSNIGEEGIMVCKKYFLGIFSVSLGKQTMNIIQVFPEKNYAEKWQDVPG
jgi:hypothetical protein